MPYDADRLALMHLRRNLLDIRAQHHLRNVLPPMRPVFPYLRSAQIINGQLLSPSGIPVIQYAADPITASIAFNPDTDTTYDVGLGNAQLFNAQGQPTGKVLVRHNWSGFTDPLMAGDPFIVGAPYRVAVSGGGYIVTYPIIAMY